MVVCFKKGLVLVLNFDICGQVIVDMTTSLCLSQPFTIGVIPESMSLVAPLHIDLFSTVFVEFLVIAVP